MRVLKLFGFVAVLFALAAGYMFLMAYQSGLWLDREFAELSRGWNADVILRHADGSSQGPGFSRRLQGVLNDLKRVHLEKATAAACTHGPEFVQGGRLDLRSRCILWARFDKGVVRFEVELKGFWTDWKITNLGLFREARDTV